MAHRFGVIGCVLVIAVAGGGCEKSDGSGAGKAPQAKGAVTPAAAAEHTQVDWAKVQVATDGSQVMGYKTVARYCDAWHKGNTPVITVQFVPTSGLADDAGNHVVLDPKIVNAKVWKGIVADAAKGQPDGSRLVATASKSNLYSEQKDGVPHDSFGILPRYKYALEVVDESTIRFVNKGKLDDGK